MMVQLVEKSKKKRQQIIKKLHFPKVQVLEPSYRKDTGTQHEMDPRREEQCSDVEFYVTSVEPPKEGAKQPLKQRVTQRHLSSVEVALQTASLEVQEPIQLDVLGEFNTLWTGENPSQRPPVIAGEAVAGVSTRSHTTRKATRMKEGIEDPLEKKQESVEPKSLPIEKIFVNLESKLSYTMQGLSKIMTELGTRFNTLVKIHSQQMAEFGAFMLEVRDKFNLCEEDRDEIRDQVFDVTKMVEDIQTQNKNLVKKIDYLENQSRRNNIKIIGLPEGMEGPDPRKFFTEWIPQVLGQEHFPEGIILEHAHRALRRRPISGPRPVLVRCLNYYNREIIL
ncbi:uncharacterized protein [Narcine bancroftii]|uniref:uncharacterized protein isoform X1 n=1 Tax=Narcine bancroftii TaxID=1343680 RepID=UPI0038320C8A